MPTLHCSPPGCFERHVFEARFGKIDTEQFPVVSQRLQIRGIPLLILYKNGGEVDRLSGARPAADITAFVRAHL